ncbi:MAG: anaerobic ribonucleoside-triphosphate reductase activating protein, partial [bacterium]|nr:anaerobic ribonucleoside-triphosphate reductase activating protein [bacterium]
MLIAGYLPSSLSDFPGKICSIIFTQGCNFKCPFCHNPELIPAKGTTTVNEDEFFAFLQKRKGKLDGVSITGGEPLIHDDIVEFIKKIKDLGFLVKIDTNGSYPQQLEKILNSGLVDFAAMDVKTSPEKYSQVTGYDIDFNKI